jgi:DNA (cytosine-5)-methyltransferase 1
MRDLPRYDLLSGGFPCQTFSMMGSQEGFEEERGQMFFRIMDMINSRHPRYVLLENVKNLMKHDGGNTIAVIKQELENAGYIVKMDVFNSNDFGLPQKRNRVIIFARRRHLGNFEFSSDRVKEAFSDIDRSKCSLDFYDSTIDVLDKQVEAKYYLSEKIKPTLLSDGSAGFKSKSEIDQLVARPLTATMHKMHRACQDNYYSDIYIQSNGIERPSERMTKDELAQISIRKLTPKEAFMLQGFPHDFAEKACTAKVADGAMYKQAGNAVSVNTIYAVLYYMITNQIIRQ